MEYNACALGACDIQKDKLAIAMQQSYYTAYWNNTKHAKKLDRVLQDIYKQNDTSNKEKPDVDVNAFLERKRRFEKLGVLKTNKSSYLPTTR